MILAGRKRRPNDIVVARLGTHTLFLSSSLSRSISLRLGGRFRMDVLLKYVCNSTVAVTVAEFECVSSRILRAKSKFCND